jgi:propanol-preferring alcohol dehydrogenase
VKAAILHEFKERLVLEDAAVPEPGPDEVLIKVEACGVCHSDLHLAEGDWSQLRGIMKRPLILGHEVVGRIVEKGGSAAELQIGDRVGVAWIHWSCDQCDICKEGMENLCPSQVITGATVDGGYAEFIKAKATHVVKVPEGLRSDEAAPLFCAGVTVYRAIKKARIIPGQRVAVFGVGGLGHLALQIAQAFGAEVMAVDISEEKLEFARALGADTTVNAATPDAVKQIRRMGRPHTAIVASASKAAYDTAFAALRPGGTLAVVGLPAEPLTFAAIAMVAAEAKIIASAVGTRADLREVLDLAAAGKVRCKIETRRLSQINEIFQEMREGRITGRIVLTL